jgi:hypothetical protein
MFELIPGRRRHAAHLLKKLCRYLLAGANQGIRSLDPRDAFRLFREVDNGFKPDSAPMVVSR